MKQGRPSVDLQGLASYLAQQEDVAAAYLFGSLARDQAGPSSDVDVAVLLTPDLELEASVERQLQLMVALDDFGGPEVQVTVLNRAPPALAYQVVRDGQLLCERDRRKRIAFEVRAMKRFFDLKPRLDFHSQFLLKQIREVGLSGRKRRHSRALEAARRIHQRLKRPAGR